MLTFFNVLLAIGLVGVAVIVCGLLISSPATISVGTGLAALSLVLTLLVINGLSKGGR